MYITDYKNMLMEIKNKIVKENLKYKNSIIIGDNSSGKSELLKMYLQENNKICYFIDSVNRTFDYETIRKENLEQCQYENVVRYRLNENIFNLKDSFDIDRTATGFIEKIYLNFEKEIKEMIYEFLNVKFEIINEENEYTGKICKLKINNEIDKLSSGYQAIIRIFLELLFFREVTKKSESCKVVVIDEINEFLSTKNEERILPFIINKFSNMNFIITTHSADVIASAVDCNIIVIAGNNQYECLDGNDFTSTTDVREIFHKIYELNENNNIDDIEVILRNLLNCKISDTWTDVEEIKLSEIKEDCLTNSQKLMLKQIKSW